MPFAEVVAVKSFSLRTSAITEVGVVAGTIRRLKIVIACRWMNESHDPCCTPRRRKTARKVILRSFPPRWIRVVTHREDSVIDFGHAVISKDAVDNRCRSFVANRAAHRDVAGADQNDCACKSNFFCRRIGRWRWPSRLVLPITSNQEQ